MTVRTDRHKFSNLTAALALLLGGSLLGASVAYAGALEDWRAGPEQGFEPRIERMTEQLDLSADQQTAIRKVMETERARLDQQRSETRKQIEALLTDAQKAKRDELMKTRLDRRLDRMDDKLDLTDDQVAKIRAIFEEQRTNPDLSRTQVRERIATVLTDVQRDKLTEEPRHHPRHDRDDRPGRRDGDCDQS
jgi:periplasmic protein CpxP/Spy